MKAAHIIMVALSLVCIGCTTPPEIKQALIDKDQTYAENQRLMQQYRELVGNVTQRHQQWYRYVQTRLKRGGSGNSDSMVSGSLASPTPPGGGEPKERGDEENETESRSDL